MSTSVVVVGAGVIGLSSAWRLADAGCAVTLVDPKPGRGASWAAAGMLAPVAELHYGEDALLGLNLAARDRWPDHAARLTAAGADVGYRECGSVLVARDSDDAAEHRRLLAVQERLGLDVEWLRGRELRSLEPSLAPSVRSGIRVDGDHQVDNRALVDAMARLCADHPSIDLVTQPAVALRDRSEGAVVELADGRAVTADRVVLAAGARTASIAGVDLPLPLRPVKGQLLHLRAASGARPTRNVRGRDCYVVTRPDGRMVVGATMEEQGFDDRPTAGAVHELLRAAWELIPAVAEATFVEAAVGFRPATPDNAPLLGPLDDRPSVILATGHHRNGVLQSALSAEAVTAWVTGRSVHPAVAPFAPRSDRGLLGADVSGAA